MTLTKPQRDEILRAHEATTKELHAVEESLDERDDDLDENGQDLRAPFWRELEKLERAYWDGLPRVSLSGCPYCGAALRRAFDPWGIDGWFWQKGRRIANVDPTACPHFAVLVGAVNLNGLPARGGTEESHLGPEVPFVIPRLLSLPGMIAVVSTVALENGYTAYPIAYFADPLPAPFDLTHPWTQTTMGFEQNGRTYWTIKNDPWDFELQPWVEARRLQWIDPGETEMRVRSTPDLCPYVGLPGLRQPIVIEPGDVLRPRPVPDGSPVGSPFE